MKPDYDVEKIYELLEKNKKLLCIAAVGTGSRTGASSHEPWLVNTLSRELRYAAKILCRNYALKIYDTRRNPSKRAVRGAVLLELPSVGTHLCIVCIIPAVSAAPFSSRERVCTSRAHGMKPCAVTKI